MVNKLHLNSSEMSMPINYIVLGSRLSTIIYSVIYTLGFLGNTFALITFSSRRMRQFSSSIFLLVLSVSDTVALVTSLWFFLADAFNIQLQNYSALACRFRTFFAYLFMDLSSWCMAGLAIDRYLRTRMPVASKKLCTPRNASLTIVGFVVILSGINGHYFSPAIGQERGNNRTTAHCLENRDQYPKYFYFYKIIWPKIDMVIFCFLPACIMILCNVNIICILKQHRRQMQNTNNDSTELVQIPLHKSQTSNGSTTSNKKVNFTQRKALERQMSLMMAACVIVFLCTTVPVTIYVIIMERLIVTNPMYARDRSFLIFVFRMLRALMFVHFGSNFYLYCLTSRIFRAEFIEAITCRKYVIPLPNEPTFVLQTIKSIETEK